MNKIDVVIPTMWCDGDFIENLEAYCSYQSIHKIYLIDNRRLKRPESNVFMDPKLHLIAPYQNIYVNPAWNEGFNRSDANTLCLLNDDIFVEQDLFDYIRGLDMSKIDIIGSYLKGTIDNFHINSDFYKNDELLKLNVNKKQPIGGQCYAFGVCMFIKRSSYRPIPSLYKIWYGDDYLVQNCEEVYAIKTNKIRGGISKTLTDNTLKGISDKRINLDTHNAYRYNHFNNSQNWDVIKERVQPSRNIFGYTN